MRSAHRRCRRPGAPALNAEYGLYVRTTAPASLTETTLHEAALAYLTHRPASVAQMRRVLARKIATWARRAAKTAGDESKVADAVARAESAAAAVMASLRTSGLLDDAAFAKRRAGSLTRAGKSRRVVELTLVRNGVGTTLARDASASDADTEIAAAVMHTRKKRMGAFARDVEQAADPKVRRRWLGSLARAGYSFGVAERALRMDREAAEALLRDLART